MEFEEVGHVISNGPSTRQFAARRCQRIFGVHNQWQQKLDRGRLIFR